MQFNALQREYPEGHVGQISVVFDFCFFSLLVLWILLHYPYRQIFKFKALTPVIFILLPQNLRHKFNSCSFLKRLDKNLSLEFPEWHYCNYKVHVLVFRFYKLMGKGLIF